MFCQIKIPGLFNKFTGLDWCTITIILTLSKASSPSYSYPISMCCLLSKVFHLHQLCSQTDSLPQPTSCWVSPGLHGRLWFPNETLLVIPDKSELKERLVDNYWPMSPTHLYLDTFRGRTKAWSMKSIRWSFLKRKPQSGSKTRRV